MRNRLSNVLWGLFFILIGIGFAGNVFFGWNFHLLFDGYWTLIIIIPCFISMVQNGFKAGSTIGFIIGVLLLANYYVDFSFNLWHLIVPAILIYIGIRIMFRGSFYSRPHTSSQNAGGERNSSQDTTYTQGPAYSQGAKQDYSAIFSSNRINITDTFVGASLNAVFGGLVLDLRQARITGDVDISAQAIFGGIDIFVPAGVRVKINNVPIFGGVSNKTGNYGDPASPVIYLNSTCMFGGIDIK
jgi:predicted membrane protein